RGFVTYLVFVLLAKLMLLCHALVFSNDLGYSSDTLRSLAEEKVRAPKLSEVRAPKLSEAIHAVDHLIELEPEEFELLLLKAHLHSYNEEHELAKEGFELTMKQDPLNAKAYSGLLMENLELKEPMEGFLIGLMKQ
ncbi:hypothetical protein RYX36_018846, partial [Vicia faba]